MNATQYHQLHQQVSRLKRTGKPIIPPKAKGAAALTATEYDLRNRIAAANRKWAR